MSLVPGQGCSVTAFAHADEAEANTGLRHFGGRPAHPPIGVIARAELRFLRGVALAGLNEGDPDALQESLRLIESAIRSVHQSLASLPEPQLGSFLKRSEEWNRVAERIRGKVSHERDAP